MKLFSTDLNTTVLLLKMLSTFHFEDASYGRFVKLVGNCSLRKKTSIKLTLYDGKTRKIQADTLTMLIVQGNTTDKEALA